MYRDDFQTEVQMQFDAWKTELDHLTEAISRLPEEARQALAIRLDSLRRTRQNAMAQFDATVTADDTRWEQLRDSLDESLRRLEQEFAAMREAYRNAGVTYMTGIESEGWIEGQGVAMGGSEGWPEGQGRRITGSEGWTEGQGETVTDSVGWPEGQADTGA